MNAVVNNVVEETLPACFGYLVNNSAVGRWQVWTQNFEIVVQGEDRSYPLTKIAEGCTKSRKYGITDTVPLDFADFVKAKGLHDASRIAGNTMPVAGNVVTLTVPALQRHPLADYTVAERFELLAEMIEVVANKHSLSTALVLTGSPGIGKTTAVTSTLKALGLLFDMDIARTDREGYIEQCDYTVLGGKTSAKGLYEKLFRYNGKLILIDDCDGALNKSCLDLLKCTLDTTGTRYVSWNIEEDPNSEIPLQFEFTGKVIFISNKNQHEIDPAIRSRVNMFDIQLTQEEILERMQQVLPNISGYADDVKADSLAYMQEIFATGRGKLCMRALIKTMQFRACKTNWRTLMNISQVA